MSDRLNGVAAFVAAVEAGGFAAAADRLALSRSAVGKTVARLEARLGVRLLQRTTRSLTLTAEGAVFYERSARALADLDAAEAAVESGRTEVVGRVRISTPVVFGRRCVAPVLRELVARHPGLEIEAGFTDRPVDLIEEGYDLAVRNGGLPDAAGLMTRRLARQRMIVCAAPAYLAGRAPPQRIEDLAEHETVAYGRGGRVRRWLFPDGQGGEIEAPTTSRLRFDDLEAMADAAAAGAGLAWLPCWLVRERLASGGLVRTMEEVPGIVFETHALWPQAPHMASRVRVVLDALAERLPGMAD